MTDREKVSLGLELCANWSASMDTCDKCPYGGHGVYGCAQLARDALKLLKEQVAIKPTKFQKEYDFRSEIVDAYRCGNCQHELDHVEKWSYCPKCGRKVKWDAAD